MALVVALPLLGVCTFNYFKHKKEDDMIKEFDIFLKNLLQSLIAEPDSLSDEDYIEQMIAMSFEENNKKNAFHGPARA